MGGDTGSIIDGRLIGGVSDRTDSPVSGLQADDGSTEAPGRLLSPVLTHRHGGWLNNTSHLSWKTAAAGSDNGGKAVVVHLTVEITRSDVRYLYCYCCYCYFRCVGRSWSLIWLQNHGAAKTQPSPLESVGSPRF